MTTSKMSAQELAQYFDHTALKPETTYAQIDRLCDEAREYNFFGVCVNSCFIERAAKRLQGSKVVPLSVVGFPLGAASTEAKVYETKFALDKGAREIDTVVNLGAYFSGDESQVRLDIAEVVRAAQSAPVKVILETALLDRAQIRELSIWSVQEGALFVKTSTGFSTRGATPGDIALMRSALQDVGALGKVGIKASGGIRDLATTMLMIDAGATRVGASASVDILKAL